MATAVIMPQMGESIAEGTITKWLVQVGQTVERDQPLLEISTDKVDAEIPSPASGILVEIRFAEGETVEVDTVIATIAEAGEESVAAGAGAPVVQATASLAGTPTESPAGSAMAEAAIAEGAVADEGTGRVAATDIGADVVSLEERLLTFSSPLVRSIAAKEGVDLAEVQGTGLHSRVTKRDIMAFLDQQAVAGVAAVTASTAAGGGSTASRRAEASPTSPAPAAAVAPPTPAAPVAPAPTSPAPTGPPATAPAVRAVPALPEFSVQAYTSADRVEIEPLSRIRQLTAAHMLYSQQTSAHVATVFDVDLSRVVVMRARAKDGFQRQHGTKLTYMPFLFKAIIAGLQAYPKFNASIDGTNIVYKKDLNLGMAVALDWGLIVPVIKNADQLSLAGLASRANDLAERARAKQLKPDEVQGGTFTVTNPGVFGSLFGTPLINQPQVAILCVGTIEKRPVVVTDRNGNDALAIRSMAYVALSYDHRLIDGADAEQFMQRVKQYLADESWSELDPYL